MHYDYLIVGAGLFGAVFAHEALNVAKNVWSLTDEIISEEIFIQRKWKKFRYTAMAHIFSTLPISRSGTM